MGIDGSGDSGKYFPESSVESYNWETKHRNSIRRKSYRDPTAMGAGSKWGISKKMGLIGSGDYGKYFPKMA